VHRTFYWASAIGALAVILVSFDANALSSAPMPNLASGVTLVAGGCGIGFHRGPYGGCRPNVVGYPAIGYGGGVYPGGAYYRGGVYRGGVYRGGVYRGGVYRGGVYRGGVYRRGFRR
jgi:hypothetical protein